MQALCQWDVQKTESDQVLLNLFYALEGRSESIGYAVKLVRGYWKNAIEIDKLIQAALEHWDLSRLSPVERNIVRVGFVELREGEVPPKVAIDEAVEIGKEYGGAESPRFINGVLDRLLKDMGGEHV